MTAAPGGSQQQALSPQEPPPVPASSQQHKLDEKKYTHSPTSRQRLKNAASGSASGAAVEAEEGENQVPAVVEQPAPLSSKSAQPRLMRAPQQQAVEARSGRSRSKSHTRYEEYNDLEGFDGSEKVQITDAPKIKEGTGLLRRMPPKEERPVEARDADSARDSSFAELTKQQTLIQQSFQSHHTVASAAQRKELGQSPPTQVALMNNYMADRPEAASPEMNEDLLTFQQARRPS